MHRFPRILIKYSPCSISIGGEIVANVGEVHVVAVDNDAGIAFRWRRQQLSAMPICGGESQKKLSVEIFLSPRKKKMRGKYAQLSESFLYEPNAAIQKSGAFDIVASRHDVLKLHPNTHLYTSDELKNDFPGRVFEVEDVFSPNKHHLRNFVSSNPQANIGVRNYPDSVAEIRKKTGIKEGGNRYVFAATLNDGQRKWIGVLENRT
jgi:hypothetical protein